MIVRNAFLNLKMTSKILLVFKILGFGFSVYGVSHAPYSSPVVNEGVHGNDKYFSQIDK